MKWPRIHPVSKQPIAPTWDSIFKRSAPITCSDIGCPSGTTIPLVGAEHEKFELVFEDSQDPSDWSDRDVYLCVEMGKLDITNSPRVVRSACSVPQTFRMRTSRDSKACCRHNIRVTVYDQLGNVRLTKTIDSSYKSEIV